MKGTLEGIAGFELTAGVVEAAELNGDLQCSVSLQSSRACRVEKEIGE